MRDDADEDETPTPGSGGDREEPGTGATLQDGARAILFDADGADIEIGPGDRLPEPGERQLLWIDADVDADGVEEVARLLGLEDRTLERLTEREGSPQIQDFERYFHVNLNLIGDDGGDPALRPVDCVVGGLWVLTTHQGPLDLMEGFLEPIHGETKLGRLTGPILLAILLDWFLNDYFRATEDVESEVDAVDEAAIRSRDPISPEEVTAKLVSLRRRTRVLRRAMTSHREVFTVMAQPEFEQLSETDSAERFRDLSTRLERAIDAIESAREMVIGSFELVMTRTAQRTNDVMKALTVISAVLLPPTLVAGILGMNFSPSFFDRPELFWVAIGAMAVLAGSILAFARRRRWF